MDCNQRKTYTGALHPMKIIFFDDDKDSKEYETSGQDIEQVFQLGEQLSDPELERVSLAIANHRKTLLRQSNDKRIQEG